MSSQTRARGGRALTITLLQGWQRRNKYGRSRARYFPPDLLLMRKWAFRPATGAKTQWRHKSGAAPSTSPPPPPRTLRRQRSIRIPGGLRARRARLTPGPLYSAIALPQNWMSLNGLTAAGKSNVHQEIDGITTTQMYRKLYSSVRRMDDSESGLVQLPFLMVCVLSMI